MKKPSIDKLRRLAVQLQGIPSPGGWTTLEVNLFNEMIEELFQGKEGEALHARLVKEAGG